MGNHLAQETSPYLLQHANNPVDWYPWSDDALEKARRENKPILLSIGYSACHWCHVMAHESFEDEETAALMNDLFINIKVDREERPDLDKIYQTAYQILTGRGGGWPLTAFLTPDQHIPYFIGTYFPKVASYQMPAFKDILRYMSTIYSEQKTEIEKQNQSLLSALHKLNVAEINVEAKISDQPIAKMRQELFRQFDSKNGGFGDAPKFPQVKYLEFLLYDSLVNKQRDPAELELVEQSLNKMAQGGIYDQVGGGFYRYAVDAQWQIPHFEKMLYDNGLLLFIYAQMYAIDPKPLYQKILIETAEWVMREMQADSGGYYAALDADSEGQEGKFYLWTTSELASILTPDEYRLVQNYFNIMQAANFEEHWHLNLTHCDEKFYKKWPEIRQKLLKARSQRVRPHRDEKIITAWNGLMIKGMVMAGIQLNRPDFILSAQKALDFIQKNLWKENRLFSSVKDGKAKLMAYLDDYVFLLDAILIYLQAQWHTHYLLFAQQLADNLIKYFMDKEKAGFFFIADDHQQLLYRPKILIDEALPAANAVAALVLQRLGLLLGNNHYLAAAENTLQLLWPIVEKYPILHASSLLFLMEYLHLPEWVIIRGKQDEILNWQQECLINYSPNRLCFAIDQSVADLPDVLAEKQPLSKTVAYVCKGKSCLSPVQNLLKLKDFLIKNV